MQNFHIVSLGEKCGKTSIAIAIFKILSTKGLHFPFKAISVTDDIIYESQYVVPWSVYVQLKQTDSEYTPDMSPVLLVPIARQEKTDSLLFLANYRCYLSGLYHETLIGDEFIKKRAFYARYAAERLVNICDHPILSEGTGNAYEEDSEFAELSNWEVFSSKNAFVILVVDIESMNVLDRLGNVFASRRDDRHLIHGVILTKITDDKNDILESLKVLLESVRVPVLGEIPYSLEAVGEEENFSAWTEYVMRHLSHAFRKILV